MGLLGLSLLLSLLLPTPPAAAAPQPRDSASVNGVKILALTPYADMVEEYPNTISAIRRYYTDYELANTNATTAGLVASALSGHDVLLVPEQEQASTSTLEALGQELSGVLQRFVQDGGTVISLGELRTHCGFLSKAGLLDLTCSGSYSSGTASILAPLHPLVDGIKDSVTLAEATGFYAVGNADTTIVVADAFGRAIVVGRELGQGHVVAIGSDYYQVTNDVAKLAANAVQWVTAILDQDRDGFTIKEGDCNDRNPNINPAATELCDGIDNDCDAQVDEGVKSTWYQDSDGDTYGSSTVSTQTCSAPNGYVSNGTDCNDKDASIHPNATEACDTKDNNCNGAVDEGLTTAWFADTDGDGYGNATAVVTSCTAPSGYVSNATDCNDSDASIHPGVSERCDQLDNDCDGAVDENAQTTFYPDQDRDGYGTNTSPQVACTAPSGYVANPYAPDRFDCNDADATIYPGAPESCDTIDQNCDGVGATEFQDSDGDGLPDCVDPDKDGDGFSQEQDCNDNNASIHPGAEEFCDGIDQNCNGSVDETFDQDRDGYFEKSACQHHISDSLLDCDDTQSQDYPGATELCDNRDNDCDGTKDEGFPDIDKDSIPDCLDDDQDGDGYTASVDCNDRVASIHPTAPESCDGIDQDCDGIADDGFDQDGDTHFNAQACAQIQGDDCDDQDSAVFPGAPELCDGQDNDCNGLSDDVPDGDDDGAELCDDCDDTRADTFPGAAEVCEDGLDQDCDGQDLACATPTPAPDTPTPTAAPSPTEMPTPTATPGTEATPTPGTTTETPGPDTPTMTPNPEVSPTEPPDVTPTATLPPDVDTETPHTTAPPEEQTPAPTDTPATPVATPTQPPAVEPTETPDQLPPAEGCSCAQGAVPSAPAPRVGGIASGLLALVYFRRRRNRRQSRS